MKNTRTILIFVGIALILLSPLVTTCAFAAKASTVAYVAVSPSTVKLGNYVVITGWTSPVSPNVTINPASGFRQGNTITITKPDGNTVVKGPITSYEDGTVFSSYTPDQLGQYSVVLSWIGDNEFSGSTSMSYYFKVETDPIYPTAPTGEIPTGYWDRPVYGDVRGMGSYVSNWLTRQYDNGRSCFNPYTTGPETAHVLWTATAWAGGVIGGEYGDKSATTIYSDYNFAIPVLMGKAYWTYTGITHCIDIYTGEELWQKAFTGSLFYSMNPSSPDAVNYRGLKPTIFAASAGSVSVYSALDGSLIETVTDSRVGITAIHKGYAYYAAGGFLARWNPYIPGNLNVTSSMYTIQPETKLNYRVAIPAGMPTPLFFYDDIGVAVNCQAAYNLTTGKLMWNVTTPDGSTTDRTNGYLWQAGASATGAYGACVQDGLYSMCNMLDRCTYAFDIKTGALAWKSAPRDYPYGAFVSYENAAGNSKVYTAAYDGKLHAYSSATGSTAWEFYSGYSGPITPYDTWPFWGAPGVIPGKVYAVTSEHSPTNPINRGNRIYCIDDNTGKEIWSISMGGGGSSIADGKLLTTNEYDGLIYCFDKGQTATTVSTDQSRITQGDYIWITGTVMDQSPAQKGTPAVSKDSMTAQMEYLHMMRPKPTNTTGVPVTLTATKSDGTVVNIGQTVSDSNGIFKFKWTPPSEDLYTVKATFAGDQSYWNSEAITTITVHSPSASPSANPTAIPSPTVSPSAEPKTSALPTEIIIAVIIGIAVGVIAATALVLKRRK